MKRALWSVLVVCAAALILPSCDTGNITPRPVANQTYYLPPIEWRIRDAETIRQAYVESGQCLEDGQTIEGFTGLDPNGVQVIYTLPPKRVDDSATLTLGHELMHVALGKDYHKKPAAPPGKPAQCG